MTQQARRFRLVLADGRTFHGAQFPSGHVAVNHPDQDGFPFVMTIAVSLDALTLERGPEDPLHSARAEWVDGADG